MKPAKTIPMPAKLAPPAPLASPTGEGYVWTDVCLGKVAEMALHRRRGDVVMEEQARRSLDVLCWSPDGYPAFVAEALDAHGLRSTPR